MNPFADGNLGEKNHLSFVTVTTLGYGDLHPIGITKVLVTVEAYTGAFMLPLFVLTMGRKIMR